MGEEEIKGGWQLSINFFLQQFYKLNDSIEIMSFKLKVKKWDNLRRKINKKFIFSEIYFSQKSNHENGKEKSSEDGKKK